MEINFNLVLIINWICFHGCVTKDAQFYEPPSLDPVIFLLEHNIYKRDVKSTLSESPSMTPTWQSLSSRNQSLVTPDPGSSSTPYPVEVKFSGSHKYYTSKVFSHYGYWNELSDSHSKQVLKTDENNPSVTVDLTFKFPFYGHKVKKVTITTKGFLYMSPFLHKYILATQYIAPLMANFDTQKGNNSDILYKDYGNRLVVEWQDLYLKDQNHTDPFLFQTTLYKNGSIVFSYRKIPIDVTNISTSNHPVKVGLSDAFYIDKVVDGQTRRSVYEYHRVAIQLTFITTNTVVMLDPLPTCNMVENCERCVRQIGNFKCKWCPIVSRCSDEIDWYRQNWMDNNCTYLAGDTTSICLQSRTTSSATTPITNTSIDKSTLTTIFQTSTMSNDTTRILSTSSSSTKLTTSITTINDTLIVPSTVTLPMPTLSQRTAIIFSTSSSTTKGRLTTSFHDTSTESSMKFTSTWRPSVEVTTPQRPTKTTTNPVSFTSKTTSDTSISRETKNRIVTVKHTQDIVHVTRQPMIKEGANTTAVIVTVVLLVALFIAGVAFWVYYGYTHPTSNTGLWLIEHRPSHLKARLTSLCTWRTEIGKTYKVENESDSYL